MQRTGVEPYEAVLLVSFGGPEGPDDVMPFLENVTAGRGISAERLAGVAEHYALFGGRSPINGQCRDLISALTAELTASGIDVPVYWGNRNWSPYLGDALAQMAADGIGRAAVLLTSAYSSYSGCRQYRENLYDAAVGVPQAPRLDKLRHYFNHPGFIAAMTETTLDALASLVDDPGAINHAHDTNDIDGGGEEHPPAPVPHLLFVTHSIPVGMNDSAGPDGGAYVAQHRSAAAVVTAEVNRQTSTEHPWDLVYCSRSGPPQVPWLEPDVNDWIASYAARGGRAVVVIPIGFVSDHMEVIFDLDTEAAATAHGAGVRFARAATVGTHPAFVSGLRDVLVERARAESGLNPARPAIGDLPASWDVCRAGCCPNPRRQRPALCESPVEARR